MLSIETETKRRIYPRNKEEPTLQEEFLIHLTVGYGKHL